MNTSVGPYQTGDSLGAVPFGELLVATHSARAEPLALLRLDDILSKDVRLRGLLRLEMARAGSLRHPAIARAIEVIESSGTLYLVVERPAGAQSLASALADGPPLSTDRVIGLVSQLAAGLDALHTRRLVHGALDPSCVLIGEDGTARIVAAGVLAATEEAGLGEAIVERQGPAFVAPEQGPSQRAVASADGYALGAIAAILVRQRPDAGALRNATAAVLDRQSARDGSRRYPVCAEFAAALAETLADAAPASRTDLPSAVPTRPVPTVQPARILPQASAPLPPPRPLAPAPIEPASSPRPVSPSITSTETIAPTTSAAASVAPLPPFADVPSAPSPAPSVEVARLAPPTSTPTRAPATPPPAAPPASLGEWVRDIIDPAAPATSRGSAASSAPPSIRPAHGQPASADRPSGPTPVTPRPFIPTLRSGRPDPRASTTSEDLTPAMRAFLGRLEERDPIGDAVRWATGRAPAVDAQIDRVCTDGKIGPVPLGIAAAGVVALLLLVVAQFLLASAVIMLVVVLYVVPRLVAGLTREEAGRQQAIKVSGPAALRRHPVGPGWDAYEIEPGNGVSLSLDQAGYARLEAVGEAVTVERPSAITSGVEQAILQHTLANVTVTYLSMSRVLLDVRDASGRVLLRHPQYDGEPGDTRATPPTPRSADSPPVSGRLGRAETLSFPVPETVRTALAAGRKAAIQRLALIAGLPLVLVLFTINTDLSFVAVFVLFAVYLVLGTPTLDRVLMLQAADRANALSRIVGPITLLKHIRRRSPQYRMLLEDGAVLEIDGAIHATLARAGQLRMAEDRSSFWGKDHSEYLASMHEVPAMRVTYEPGGGLLLEIVNPAGDALYRDPALGDNAILTPA